MTETIDLLDDDAIRARIRRVFEIQRRWMGPNLIRYFGDLGPVPRSRTDAILKGMVAMGELIKLTKSDPRLDKTKSGFAVYLLSSLTYPAIRRRAAGGGR